MKIATNSVVIQKKKLIIKKNYFTIIIIFCFVSFFGSTALAQNCRDVTKKCTLCGGDGLEDAGERIFRPKSEWKDKYKCRLCDGKGTHTVTECDKVESKSTPSAKRK